MYNRDLKWSKLACKKNYFGMIGLGQDKQQHPAVHAEELAGGGSVAVAVGVSDM